MPTLFTALRAHRKRPRAKAKPTIPPAFGVIPGAPAYTAEIVAVPTRTKEKKRKPEEPTRKMSLRDLYVVRRKAPPGRVIVVGGGFAGLSTAYELESLGYEVIVLEGREEVGGRVESRRDIVPGEVMEGGAELIGRNHPAWWSYKRKFDLHFRRLSDPPSPPIYLDGQRLCGPRAVSLGEEVDRVQKRINRIAKRVNANEPWKSRHARALDRLSLAQALNRIPMSRLCRLTFVELLQTDNGIPAERQSWLGNLAMIKGGGLSRFWEDTETHHCVEGNQALAFAFKKALKRVVVGAKVGTVEVRDSRVVVSLDNGRKEKKKGKKGELKFEANDVVLAIPPTKLKSVKFRPPLPSVYSSGQFANNFKYLLNVRQGSWKPEAPNFSSDGPLDLTWNGTDGQPGRRAGIVFFSGSNDAMTVRHWSKKRYLKELSVVYPELARRCGRGLPMDWPGNEWTKGSYSFPKPGEVNRVGPVLRSGYLGRVHFAGEHTCYAFTGYMEGALQSGIRVAKQIAKRDGVLGQRRRTRSASLPAKGAVAPAGGIPTLQQTP